MLFVGFSASFREHQRKLYPLVCKRDQFSFTQRACSGKGVGSPSKAKLTLISFWDTEGVSWYNWSNHATNCCPINLILHSFPRATTFCFQTCKGHSSCRNLSRHNEAIKTVQRSATRLLACDDSYAVPLQLTSSILSGLAGIQEYLRRQCFKWRKYNYIRNSICQDGACHSWRAMYKELASSLSCMQVIIERDESIWDVRYLDKLHFAINQNHFVEVLLLSFVTVSFGVILCLSSWVFKDLYRI